GVADSAVGRDDHAAALGVELVQAASVQAVPLLGTVGDEDGAATAEQAHAFGEYGGAGQPVDIEIAVDTDRLGRAYGECAGGRGRARSRREAALTLALSQRERGRVCERLRKQVRPGELEIEAEEGDGEEAD